LICDDAHGFMPKIWVARPFAPLGNLHMMPIAEFFPNSVPFSSNIALGMLPKWPNRPCPRAFRGIHEHTQIMDDSRPGVPEDVSSHPHWVITISPV
jgi:hypothetical protein